MHVQFVGHNLAYCRCTKQCLLHYPMWLNLAYLHTNFHAIRQLTPPKLKIRKTRTVTKLFYHTLQKLQVTKQLHFFARSTATQDWRTLHELALLLLQPLIFGIRHVVITDCSNRKVERSIVLECHNVCNLCPAHRSTRSQLQTKVHRRAQTQHLTLKASPIFSFTRTDWLTTYSNGQ
jgi:hypothetical protein